jgi:hypothetical protein
MGSLLLDSMLRFLIRLKNKHKISKKVIDIKNGSVYTKNIGRIRKK